MVQEDLGWIESRGPTGPTEQGKRRAPRRHADWRRWLAGRSPREILVRIVQGDPLGVRSIVASRLRARALLLDAEGVHLRALARCARYAVRYTGRPALTDWLAEQVDGSIGDLLVAETLATLSRGNQSQRG